MPASILVLYAHPTPHLSVANRQLAEAIRDLPNVELVDLYETNPDFHFDVAAEQQRLEQASMLVFQHPLHWYGTPALLKQWTDVVLTRGWAYGRGGNALRGKDFMLAVTTGGNELDYRDQGHHGHAFEAFLPPLRQMARYCGMHWQQPLVLHAARRSEAALLAEHTRRYRHLLQSYPAWREHDPHHSPNQG
jgi:glutathione-regulated potassium-efflux system ancillary protein KefF